MSDIAISVDGLGKRYRIGAAATRHDDLRSAIVAAVKAPLRNLSDLRRLSRFEDESQENTVWALKDISFEVRRGEVLGIIGRNGAGKSTLLKVLSRITEPTIGTVRVRGRVGALLEVGTGFHQELTGRENIYLNGSILGMDKRYIDRKFDQIVEFSGVKKFIDTPVKRYSSGMYLRLAFSVAAHLEPEVLVVDEVLAVGDAEFQKKCLDKMEEVAGEGRTVLFVSHNLAAVSALTENAVLLSQGRFLMKAATSTAISHYLALAAEQSARAIADRSDRRGSGVARFTNIEFLDAMGRVRTELVSGSEYTLRMWYAGAASLRAPTVRATIYTSSHQPLIHFDSSFYGGMEEIAAKGAVSIHLRRLPLAAGQYSLNVSLTVSGDVADHLDQAISFSVLDGNFFASGRNATGIREICLTEHAWTAE
jgi:lipopolysaccharide transport system ATP-binding protein